ncbi:MULTISPECIES: hypothetical protein [Isoptericola]|uniref:Uncharacterized protein n=1 Tax=Isoptericola sediminis TaxID=2733572 RepID=A0A849KG46_9MICO|nr:MULTISPECIES: hypothetical protein [Isoptericola]MDO8143901.1 hypothetical protein [Isoptericola sp. 178]MDO8149325.1 hypothetical protein [Isoptericola sp. b515]MDO8152264.1 hypothetical protein [Isoptericola sp. b408]NNU27523.1 hypothetical protein [Isoptericola sediminis]
MKLPEATEEDVRVQMDDLCRAGAVIIGTIGGWDPPPPGAVAKLSRRDGSDELVIFYDERGTTLDEQREIFTAAWEAIRTGLGYPEKWDVVEGTDPDTGEPVRWRVLWLYWE